MKFVKSIIVGALLFCNCNYAQIQENRPLNFRKINFVYRQKSDLFFENEGVYADTLFFKIYFPNMKIDVKKKNVTDDFFLGFAKMANMQKAEKSKLVSIIYHENQEITGVYDAFKNITILKIARNDKIIKDIAKNFLNINNLKSFYYSIKIDYSRNLIKTICPAVNYKDDIDKIENKIIFDENSDLAGYYKLATLEYVLLNRVELLPDSSNKITTGVLFANNNFGIKKIISIGQSTELISLSYE